MMKEFLDRVYDKGNVDEFLATIPASAFPAFYLFSRLLPDMIPRHAFDDLVQGYEMDLAFSDGPIREASPIKTHDDLILYADRVAGSVADMICHLAWAILEDEHGKKPDPERKKIIGKAREMGQALQLVNVARDIRTDALLQRLYIPLTEFDNLDLMADRDYSRYTLPLLATANKLRDGSARDIERLPRTARAGTRAMVASYFEIGKEVERRGGKLDAERVRVPTWRRIRAVLRCFWGWSRT
jgi:15-cis-phytoene synthase/lycopene beta-cyclase